MDPDEHDDRATLAVDSSNMSHRSVQIYGRSEAR